MKRKTGLKNTGFIALPLGVILQDRGFLMPFEDLKLFRTTRRIRLCFGFYSVLLWFLSAFLPELCLYGQSCALYGERNRPVKKDTANYLIDGTRMISDLFHKIKGQAVSVVLTAEMKMIR